MTLSPSFTRGNPKYFHTGDLNFAGGLTISSDILREIRETPLQHVAILMLNLYTMTINK